VIAYFDANADGVWDRDEEHAQEDAIFLLTGSGGWVADHISTRSREPFCFNAILGDNWVEVQLPEGMERSTVVHTIEEDVHYLQIGAYVPATDEVPEFDAMAAGILGLSTLGIYTFLGWTNYPLKKLSAWVGKKFREQREQSKANELLIPTIEVASVEIVSDRDTGFAPKRRRN